jgi:DNA-binding NtrC family response regulator
MRLMLIGAMQSYVSEAGRIAMGRGAKVAHAEDIDVALTALRSGKGADLVLIDVKEDIRAFVTQLKAERITVPIVAFGIGNDAAAAVRAIKAGAREYMPLPPDATLIAAVLEAVVEESETVIASDPAMLAALSIANQVATSDATVLIRGESGTGKEVLAKFLHRKSKRSGEIFVSVNCAAIPEQLLESELFGHEKGAFTGAIARRIGKFEEADGGTLLLDEISEMHPRLQAKLLRAVQEREIDRVGGTTPVKVNIRLLATTNRDLEEEVKLGNFREDLFYRLNVISITLPSLRDRPKDILDLARYFIKKYSDSNGIEERTLSEEAADKLRAHVWRGNVRELENTMHRAVLLAQGETIAPEAVMLAGGKPEPVKAESATANTLVGRTVAEVEQDLILGTLSHCLGNRTHAANILGISIRTLRNKLRDYAEQGVPVPPHGGEAAAEHAIA